MKRLLIALLSVLLMLMLVYLTKPKDYYIGGFIVSLGVKFSIINKEGEDLLNPDHPNCFRKEDIKLFYLIDNKIEEITINDSQKGGFTIYKREDKFYMDLTPNIYMEKLPITYIQWSENDMDTLQCEFTREPNASIICTKFWFNGELITERHPTKGRYLEIVK